ncbi:hypothetical protein SDC9_188439 [bioreactor metagenome]|uniref:Zn-finger containing protein n=1 Tax=bioreactor metagenome TaxID=1076179 RepID=A0A645HRQ9_9ZZZZ
MNYNRRYYGFDLLSIFLFFLSFLLSLWQRTTPLGLFLFIYSTYRVFSKNTYKRQKEYDIFYTYTNKILNKIGIKLPYYIAPLNFNAVNPFINNLRYKINQRRQFKITKCPYCKQKLRLPRGKGKITVTCKTCLKEFKFKT